MMKYVCDICGKDINNKNPKMLFIGINEAGQSIHNKTFEHICVKCKESLLNHIEELKKNENTNT